MNKKILLLTLIFVLFLQNIFSLQAEFKIDVKQSGKVDILSKTNSQEDFNFKNSDKFTSKKGEYWILNVSFDKVFESFFYEITLPENSKVNYVKLSKKVSQQVEKNRIKYTGFDENKKVNLIVQYKIQSKFFSYIPYILIVLAPSFVVIIILFFKKKVKRVVKEKKELKKFKEKRVEFDYSYFPQRQKDIIEILKKNNFRCTQKEIFDKMEIPKSSISRNIKTLEIKGYLRCEKIGKTKFIFLKNSQSL